MPVSVKTRIGFNKNEIETWLPELLAEKPALITSHGRTKKEMLTRQADWNVIARAVEIAKGSGVLIMGNGDIKSLKDGVLRAKKSKVNGIMVGRGIFGNPWFFNRKIKIEKVPLEQRLYAMIEHAKIFEKELKGIKNYDVIKKHYATYARGFDNAKELRVELMKAKSAKQAEKVVENFIKKIAK